ncbi:patatin-like phospholipase family protein [Reinekea blandensis]|uniref:Predicted esterase of the alpha-beta hydrolase superfamily protein n=1 Tax=Reinekea blandensis MED297 TaxID=314283 RepID=A4BH59_9GAMM|nr:patatin-like phospholipase family protein [Reinekea blandensis]EAR08558.1 predicted esterase of the alpha-beta hydrolase superfamily protein [Reinekea sp. MED297] [Reinekea blandensis MED297]
MGVQHHIGQPTIALALAGGGPMGGLYELGALLALQQALPSIRLHHLPMYVGVSAGSVIASALANQFSIREIADNLLRPDDVEHPIHPSLFYSPAWGEYRHRITSIPGLTWQAIYDYLRNPRDESLLESFTRLKQVLPAGFFDNRPIERYLRKLFQQYGITNDFRKLDTQLMIVAADLDCGRSVVFGHPEWDDVPISTAVQASTCVPGLYVPVRIHDHYFVDGILYKTVHASAALDAGADLVFCFNPIVPYCNRQFLPDAPEQTSIIREGSVGIISQAIRAMVHSRSVTGFRQYQRDYPDKDIILFEPKPDDAVWFFANEFSFRNRVQMVDSAYRATLADISQRQDELNGMLAPYGLAIQPEHLNDGPSLPESIRQRRRLSPHMKRLRTSLDRLENQYMD